MNKVKYISETARYGPSANAGRNHVTALPPNRIDYDLLEYAKPLRRL